MMKLTKQDKVIVGDHWGFCTMEGRDGVYILISSDSGTPIYAMVTINAEEADAIRAKVRRKLT